MKAPLKTDLHRRLRRKGRETKQPRRAAEAYAPPAPAADVERETWLEMRRQFAAWG